MIWVLAVPYLKTNFRNISYNKKIKAPINKLLGMRDIQSFDIMTPGHDVRYLSLTYYKIGVEP